MKSYKTAICQNKNCNKLFSIGPGCTGKYCSLICSYIFLSEKNKARKNKEKESNMLEYEFNPKYCIYCNLPIEYKYKKNKFCNRSCAASFNNKGRICSADTRIKTSISIIKWHIENNKHRNIETPKITKKSVTSPITHNVPKTKKTPVITPITNTLPKITIAGEYTKIYKCICKKTGLVFFSKYYRKYHPTIYSDRSHYKSLCQFTFSIAKFPKWFSGTQIKLYGWYSLKNKNGISRDHKISISYGWKNNIDPYIISHPANCELLRHRCNQKKHTDNSILLSELLEDIKKFENLYPNWS